MSVFPEWRERETIVYMRLQQVQPSFTFLLDFIWNVAAPCNPALLFYERLCVHFLTFLFRLSHVECVSVQQRALSLFLDPFLLTFLIFHLLISMVSPPVVIFPKLFYGVSAYKVRSQIFYSNPSRISFLFHFLLILAFFLTFFLTFLTRTCIESLFNKPSALWNN